MASHKPGQEPALHIMIDSQNRAWRIMPDDGDEWIDIGIAPRPKTTWQAFWHHVFHGLLMQYSLSDVFDFAWRNRHISNID